MRNLRSQKSGKRKILWILTDLFYDFARTRTRVYSHEFSCKAVVALLRAAFSRSIDSRINKGAPRLVLDVYQRITIQSPHFNKCAASRTLGKKYLIAGEISAISGVGGCVTSHKSPHIRRENVC